MVPRSIGWYVSEETAYVVVVVVVVVGGGGILRLLLRVGALGYQTAVVSRHKYPVLIFSRIRVGSDWDQRPELALAWWMNEGAT